MDQTLAAAALAGAVQGRRLQLNLSIIRAASTAGLSKDTWKRVERAEPVRDITYSKIEDVLGWTQGSIAEILGGGSPTLIEPAGGDGITFARIPEEDIGQAVTGAMVAVADNLTAAEIREVSRLAVEELKRRGLV